MKTCCLLLMGLLFCQLVCMAQKDSIVKKEGYVYGGVVYRQTMNYKTSLNISPLALLNVDNEVMAGLEHRLAPNWSFALDAGVIFDSYYLSEIKKAWGFEVRPAVRYYYDEHQRTYLQTQLFYKQVDYGFHDWLGKDAVNRVPAYEKLQDFTFRKKVLSLSFQFGALLPLSDQFFIDIYGGLGGRYKDQGVTESNAVYTTIEDGSLIRGPKVWTICMPVGAKICYIIK